MMNMSLSDRIALYLLCLGIGSVMGFWGCVVSAHDDHILTVGECMVKVANEKNISTQEAWIICERNQ